MRHLVPNFIIQRFKGGHFTGQFRGISLFVDISGFTQLTETLMQRKREGAEILTGVLNAIFNPLVASVYGHGGFVANFAGDAFTAIFPMRSPESTLVHAFQAALDVQRFFVDHPVAETRFGSFLLGVKVGVGEGVIEWHMPGDQNQRTFLFKGSGIDASAHAEHQAMKGDLIIPVTMNRVASDLGLQQFPAQNKRYTRIQAGNWKPVEQFAREEPSPERDILKQFFPDSVVNFLAEAEFRNICSVFISFTEPKNEDDLNQLVITAHRLCRQYGGYLNKVDFGDKGGVMLVLFGAPITHENDPERAAEFCLSLKKAELSVELRIGMTYGMVYAGIMGGRQRCEYSAIGDVVNVSARFMMTSSFGDIWISQRLSRFLDGKYETAYFDDLSFKGKSERIPVYRLTGRKTIHAQLFSNKFIGRVRELDTLKNSFDRIIQTGQSETLLVYGDAGTGKSHLLAVFGDHQAKVTGSTCLETRADEIIRKPYNAITGLLEHYYGLRGIDSPEKRAAAFSTAHRDFLARLSNSAEACPDSGEEITRVVMELTRTESMLAVLCGVYEDDSLYSRLTPQERHNNTLMAIRFWIAGHCLQNPVILVLDDAQWLEEETWTAIRLIQNSLADHKLMILIVSRYEDDGNKPAFPMGNARVSEIDLNALDKQSCREIIKSMVLVEPDNNLLAFLFQKSRGIPFYLQQLLEFCRERELLFYKENECLLKALPDEIPDSISAVILARIDRLDAIIREVIKAASVIGKEFEIEILSHVLRHDVRQPLQSAEDSQILGAISEILYVFRHALIRDTAYSMQLLGRLQELHRLTANALASVKADNLKPVYANLAFHYDQAKMAEEAIEFYNLAADFERDQFQNKKAVSHYLRSLELLREQNASPEKMGALYLEAAQTYRIYGDLEEYYSLLKEGHDFSIQGAHSGNVARALCNMAQKWFDQGNLEKSREYLCKAKEISTEKNLKKALATIAAIEGMIALTQGDIKTARKGYLNSLRISTEINDSKRIIDNLYCLGTVAENTSELETAREYYGKQKKFAEKIDDEQSIAMAMGNLARILSMENNFSGALDLFEQQFEIGKKRGDFFMLCDNATNRGVVLLELGDYLAADDCFSTAAGIARQLGSDPLYFTALGNKACVLRLTGQVAAALESFQSVIKAQERLDMLFELTEWYYESSLCHLALGHPDKGYLLAGKCLELANKIDRTDILVKAQVSQILCSPELDHSAQETALRKLFDQSEEIQDQALILFEIWKLKDTEVNRVAAAKMLERAHEAYGSFVNRIRLQEIGGAEG